MDDGVKNGSGEERSAAPPSIKRGRVRGSTKGALRDLYVVLQSVLLEVRVRARESPLSGPEVANMLDARLRVWKEMYL